MARIILLFWLSCPLLVLSQQATISGRTEANGKPLVYCSISLDNTVHTLTDSAGLFIFSHVTPGRHQLAVSYTGMNNLVKSITVSAGQQLVITIPLSENAVFLDDVVVTGVAGSSKIKNTPIAVAAVSRKEMQYNTNTNIIDALVKTVPGVTAVTTGPNISKPFIRGLGYNRVLTMYDGVRQEGQQWGDEHGAEMDPYGIVRAEVVKGPASISYGSDALAGVVNLLPDMPNGNEDKVYGEALLEYQTNNRMMGGSIAANQRHKSMFWSVRGSAKAATNYANPVDGRVYATGFREEHISAMAGIEKTNLKSYIHATLYNNLQEIPDGSRDSLSRRFTRQVHEGEEDDIKQRPIVPDKLLTSYRIVPLHQHIQHYRVYNKTTLHAGAGEWSSLIGFQQNRRREYNHPVYLSQAGLDVLLTTINYELKYQFVAWKGIQLTTGINGMYQNNQHKDATDFPIPAYTLFDAGAFLLAKKEGDHFAFSGGIRYDNRHIHWNDFYTITNPETGFQKQATGGDTAGATLRFTNNRQSFHGFSASAGVAWHLSPMVTLKVNVANGYRAPNITETGANGLDPGAHIYYIGNQNFIPETNWQQDVGVFYHDQNIAVSAEAFYNYIKNFIFLQKVLDENGLPLQVVAGNNTYQYKQASALLYGLETSVNWQPQAAQWLSVKNSAAVIRGLNKDETLQKQYGREAKYLPLIPPFHSLTTVRVDVPLQSQHIKGVYLQAEAEHNSRQNRFYAADDTETATPGYTLCHAGLGFAVSNQKDMPVCKVYLNASNLFNVAYQSNLNRLKYFEYYAGSPTGRTGIYNMGRNISIKAIFSL